MFHVIPVIRWVLLFLFSIFPISILAIDPLNFTINEQVYSFKNSDINSNQNGLDVSIIAVGIAYNGLLIKKSERLKYAPKGYSGFGLYIKTNKTRLLAGLTNFTQDFEDKEINNLNFQIRFRGLAILYRYETDRYFGIFPGFSIGPAVHLTQLACADNKCKSSYPDSQIKEHYLYSGVAMFSINFLYFELFTSYYYFLDSKIEIKGNESAPDYSVPVGNDIYIVGLGWRF